jgi:AcrR family transcriptional regulator
MKKQSRPTIAARKRPRQARSTQLVDDILEAAIRVLVREGGARFTTVRVADEAGVSVGSLYQYFPSKAALLFRLQADEWTDTWDLVSGILSDRGQPPMDRLERAVVTFFRSELEESALRVALDETGVSLADVPEKRALLATATTTVLAFLEEALPGAPASSRAFAADLVMTSMAAVAEKVTEREPSRREVDRWARATTEMFVAYLNGLEARGAS